MLTPNRRAVLGATLAAPFLAGRASAQAARLIVDALTRLPELTPIPQDDSRATHAPMLVKEVGPVPVTGRVLSIDKLEKGGRVVLTDLSIPRIDPAAAPGR